MAKPFASIKKHSSLILAALFCVGLFFAWPHAAAAATRTISNTGGNWSSTSTWVEGVVPTSSDDVVATATSGNVTIDVNANCNSIDLTGYTGTLTHNSNITLSIGSSIPGANNNALIFPAGMTYTVGSITSQIIFVSTSGTAQGINFGGKNPGNITFNGAGGSWKLIGDLTSSTANGGASIFFDMGTFDVNGYNITTSSFISSNSNLRTINLGSGTITVTNTSVAWTFATVTNLTFNAGTSTIVLNNNSSPSFQGGGLTYHNVTFSAANSALSITGSNTFANLIITTAPSRSPTVSFSADQTINGTLTITGYNSTTNRILIQSDTAGTPRTLTAAAVSITNADFQDITGAGSANWNLSAITGNSGDCGGNSGITFTPSATQTWAGTIGGNWSTNAWTTRVPLCQDNVIISAAFSANQTVTADINRLGKSIDWTGTTGNPTFSTSTNTVYGSLTLISGMTLNAIGILTFSGRGSYTITSAGQLFSAGITINTTGTYSLADDLTLASTKALTLTAGTFDANGHNVTTGVFSSSTLNVRTLAMGTGIWTLLGTGVIWNTPLTTNFTLNSSTSSIAITDTSTSAKTFSGGNLTYYNLSISGGGTGSVTVIGSNAFNDFTIGAPKTIKFTSNSIQTIGGSFSCTGSSGNVITMNTSFLPTQATLFKSLGTVNCDYLSLSGISAAGGATWNPGSNSTNVVDNSGWAFTGATRTISDAGGNWSSTSTWVEGVVPTSYDDVVATATSGNVTIDQNAYVRSIDLTNYTATLTQNAFTLTIGNSTANAGNNALVFPSTMTYTPNSLSTLSFVSTTTATQAINFGGKSVANVTFSGAGGSWKLFSDLSAATPAGTTVTLTRGSLDTNNYNVTTGQFSSSNTNNGIRSLSMGSSTWTLYGAGSAFWNIGTTPAINITLNAGTSTIALVGDSSNISKIFQGGGLTYNNVTFTGNTFNIGASNIFNTITLNCAGLSNGMVFSNGTTQTISNLITNSSVGNLVVLGGPSTGSATLSKSSGTISIDYVSMTNLVATGGATWYAGANSIDGGGNSGWIFASPVTNTAPSFTTTPTGVGPEGKPQAFSGQEVTFTATASDPEGDPWYLAVCKTNSITPNTSSAPTCPGGSYATSTQTVSNSQAQATYTAQKSDQGTWYAFACDYNASSLCSTSTQGQFSIEDVAGQGLATSNPGPLPAPVDQGSSLSSGTGTVSPSTQPATGSVSPPTQDTIDQATLQQLEQLILQIAQEIMELLRARGIA